MGLRRRASTQNYLPLGYLAIAIVLAALLLPSALRPPPDQQNATASFSPDAPPDENPPELVLQTLRQAQSSTAGAQQTTETEVVEEAAPPPPPPPPRKATRGRCFGDPPRQTESLYSALCVPAYTGTDNGGATAKGVTADQITIAIQVSTSSTVPEGPLEREFRETDTESTHELKVWQTYFNDRFEFYGRYLQFHIVKVSTTDEDQARAGMQAAASAKPFAYIPSGNNTSGAAAAAEAIRLQMITFVPEHNPVDFYHKGAPYAYGFDMDSWQTRAIGPELACKHWWGKPPDMNRKMDATFDYNAPRVFGLVLYQDGVRAGARKMYEDNFRRLCGGEFKEVAEYNLNDNQAAIGDTMTKMRAAGVTTVMVAVDPLTPPILTTVAGRMNYFPEWIGVTGTSSNGTGRLMNDDQAMHYVSISQTEIPRADPDKDWYRAYKEIDPDGEPTSAYFRDLQQLAGGIQGAGTNLTPETFWEGLTKIPCREPQPEWSIGGCYKKGNPASDLHYMGDYSYADYVALQWFDNAGDDPDSTSAGAWCYMHGGRRYKYGGLPTEPLPFRDPAQCIFTPEKGVQG